MTEFSGWRIGIIDDDSDFTSKFQQFFSGANTDQCIFTALSLTEIIEGKTVLPNNLDVLFLDIMLPGMLGIDGVSHLKMLLPKTPIVMFTIVENEEFLLKALCSGAEGYLLKNSNFSEVQQYLQIMKAGGSVISPTMARYLVSYFGPKSRPSGAVLTEKNLQVLHLLAEGWAYKTIADRMNISIDGVRYHIKEIYRALGVQSTAQAVRRYILGDLPIK